MERVARIELALSGRKHDILPLNYTRISFFILTHFYEKNHLNLSFKWFFYGAGSGNRTRIASLEGWNSTIELHLQFLFFSYLEHVINYNEYFFICQEVDKIFLLKLLLLLFLYKHSPLFSCIFA